MNKVSRLLLYIQHNLSQEKLIKLYGEQVGSHLWDKFLYYDRNLLMFINYLDKDNRPIFMDFDKNRVLFGHCSCVGCIQTDCECEL